MASAMVRSALRNVQLRRTPANSARTFSSKPGIDDARTCHLSLAHIFLVTWHTMDPSSILLYIQLYLLSPCLKTNNPVSYKRIFTRFPLSTA